MANSRMDKDHIRLSIGMTNDGYVLSTDVMGKITHDFVNLRVALQEKATRDFLIQQGWTPPTTTNPGTRPGSEGKRDA